MTMILGGDWGAYLNVLLQVQFNYDDLVKKAGLQFMVFRGAQEQTSQTEGNYSTMKNLEVSRRFLPVSACYYWHSPDANQKVMLNYFTPIIEKENPAWVGVDLEQTLVWDANSGRWVQVDPQRFSDTAQELCEGLRDRFPEKQVVPYTRQNIITQYSPPMVKWLPSFDGNLWEARWRDYGLIPYTMTWEQIRNFEMKDVYTDEVFQLEDDNTSWLPGCKVNRLRQHTSRVEPPYPEGSLYDHQYDWNVYYGTLQDMLRWIKKETLPMASAMYDQNVPQAQRATVITLTDDQAHADLSLLAPSTDGFILKMGGMDGQEGLGQEVYEESAWRIRVPQVAALKRPTIGMFPLSASLHLFKQVMAPTADKWATKEGWTDNVGLKSVLTGMRNESWTFETLQPTTGWLPVHALTFPMYHTNTKTGKAIGPDWQKRTIRALLEPLMQLQNEGKIPNIPLIVYGTPGFFDFYKGTEFLNYLYGLRNRIYLGLGKPFFATSPTALVLTPEEAWSYRLLDSDNIGPIPWGYGSEPNDVNNGHVVYYEVSYNRFVIVGVTDSSLNPVPSNTNFWCQDKASMYSWLNFKPGDVEVPPVDPTLKSIVARLELLEQWRKDLGNSITTLPK
jgi:hypothetical protein